MAKNTWDLFDKSGVIYDSLHGYTEMHFEDISSGENSEKVSFLISFGDNSVKI